MVRSHCPTQDPVTLHAPLHQCRHGGHRQCRVETVGLSFPRRRESTPVSTHGPPPPGGDKKRVIPAGLRHSPRALLSKAPEHFIPMRGALLRGAFPECFCRGRESIPSSRRCTTRCLLSSASQRRA